MRILCYDLTNLKNSSNNIESTKILQTRNSMNKLLSYCRLADAGISAREKDLPVPFTQHGHFMVHNHTFVKF